MRPVQFLFARSISRGSVNLKMLQVLVRLCVDPNASLLQRHFYVWLRHQRPVDHEFNGSLRAGAAIQQPLRNWLEIFARIRRRPPPAPFACTTTGGPVSRLFTHRMGTN